MCVEYTSVLVVSPVHLKEMGPEVLDHGFIVVGPITKRCDAGVRSAG